MQDARISTNLIMSLQVCCFTGEEARHIVNWSVLTYYINGFVIAIVDAHELSQDGRGLRYLDGRFVEPFIFTAG